MILTIYIEQHLETHKKNFVNLIVQPKYLKHISAFSFGVQFEICNSRNGLIGHGKTPRQRCVLTSPTCWFIIQLIAMSVMKQISQMNGH